MQGRRTSISSLPGSDRFHSDGVRLIIALDHRLFGLALSSQIPPFFFYLPMGNVLMDTTTRYG